MGTRRAALIAGVLVIASIVTGCGGDDSSTSTSTSSISKAEFIRKADAVCKRSNKRMEVAFASFLESNKDIKRPSEADFEELVGKVLVPNLEREIKELRALEVPSGDEDRVDGMVEALEEGLETAESNPAAVTSTSDAVFGIASRLADEYGLKTCGSR